MRISRLVFFLALSLTLFGTACQKFEPIIDQDSLDNRSLGSDQSQGPATTAIDDSNSGSSNSPSSPVGMTPLPSPTPSPSPNPMVSPTIVGAGFGGLRVTSKDGFASIQSRQINVSGRYFTASAPNCIDPKAVVIGGECCYQNQYSCFSTSGHSDFQFRGLTHGGGLFIGVGGARFGILQTSADGLQWSPKINLHKDFKLIQGAKNNASWLADVAYGNGLFVAVEGIGSLLYSADGQNWFVDQVTPYPGAPFREIFFIEGVGFYAFGSNGLWGFSRNGRQWDQIGFFADGLQRYSMTTDGQRIFCKQAAVNGVTQVYVMDPQVSLNWSPLPSVAVDSNHYQPLIFAKDKNKLYLMGADKTAIFENGQWAIFNTNVRFSVGIYAAGQFIGQKFSFQNGISQFFTSSDGITWSQIPDLTPGDDQFVQEFAAEF